MTNFMRVWVVVDISKSLRRCLRVDALGDGVESVMLLKYERFPNFYFRCDFLGHTFRECPGSPNGLAVVKGDKLLFGIWMRGPTQYRRQCSRDDEWTSRMGGDRGNLRPIDRTEADSGCGRRVEPRMKGSDRNGKDFNKEYINSIAPNLMVMDQRSLASPLVLTSPMKENGKSETFEKRVLGDEFEMDCVHEISGPQMFESIIYRGLCLDRLKEAGQSISIVIGEQQSPGHDSNPQIAVQKPYLAGNWKRRARTQQQGSNPRI
ncbi:hypothetical protein Dsin_008111 [Dipteronia sinensis]|uniref:Zinc knuckle CX2CX4HX4C domain-containing protein n=1 Tax=Dipteronia sinensis TaxID=43782 RepID=A0AAE0EHH0_9ROSI|nr:hypothetical protein Dsin_008111 [Dipteronia sinensis]